MKRLLLSGLILACVALAWTPPTHAANCEATTSAQTYSNGAVMGAMSCDTAGNQRVIMGAPGGAGTATADPPTLTEASTGYFSWDLSGNLRVTLGTLLAGEDQTNNLIMTGAGVTRITTMGPVTSATTSSITTVPSGPKTFMAYMGGASESKAATLMIYGNWQNSTTGGQPLCRITILAATVTHIEDFCPKIDSAFTYYYYTAEVYTSASAASLYVYAMY